MYNKKKNLYVQNKTRKASIVKKTTTVSLLKNSPIESYKEHNC